jgi:Domain of unknown function (DUF4430)
VLRRSLVLALAVVSLCALAPVEALAARVTVRVEGRSQTIFGKAPRAVEASNALEALDAASVLGEFYFHVTRTSFGPYVDQIGRHPAGGTSGWVFKVNGASPPAGADQVQLREGDSVLWYWADFDPTSSAGPRTLLLQKTSARCYAAFLQDDTGARTTAGAVRVWVGGRPRTTASTGRFCLPRHTGLVHVTRDGAVRSNALP